jgi:hypothetical protein
MSGKETCDSLGLYAVKGQKSSLGAQTGMYCLPEFNCVCKVHQIAKKLCFTLMRQHTLNLFRRPQMYVWLTAGCLSLDQAVISGTGCSKSLCAPDDYNTENYK